jgi:hypothetical protein
MGTYLQGSEYDFQTSKYSQVRIQITCESTCAEPYLQVDEVENASRQERVDKAILCACVHRRGCVSRESHMQCVLRAHVEGVHECQRCE